MESKHMPSPVRRSATPEQPTSKSSTSHHDSAVQPTNSSPANKKQRGAGEGDGPLNLSKPKGKF